jgi:hypothetical protein
MLVRTGDALDEDVERLMEHAFISFSSFQSFESPVQTVSTHSSRKAYFMNTIRHEETELPNSRRAK